MMNFYEENRIDEKYFFLVENLKFADLLNWQNEYDVSLRKGNKKNINCPDHNHNLQINAVKKKWKENYVEINDEKVALFRVGNHVYGIQAICPHAGGPLHLADIEDLGTNKVSVKCPWHKWKFRLSDGSLLCPKGHPDKSAKVYPVQVRENGQLYIGFDSFGPSAFNVD